MVALLYAPDELLSYGTGMAEDYRVRRVQFQGYSQRSEDGLNSQIQQWNLVWENILHAEAEALRVFFRDLAGTGIIDWTPFNQTVELKFTGTNFQSQPTGAKTSTCSAVLTQEFDL